MLINTSYNNGIDRQMRTCKSFRKRTIFSHVLDIANDVLYNNSMYKLIGTWREEYRDLHETLYTKVFLTLEKAQEQLSKIKLDTKGIVKHEDDMSLHVHHPAQKMCNASDFKYKITPYIEGEEI